MNQDEINDLIQRAESGDVECQVELGARLATGDGITKNKDAAFRWYQKAADQESSEAQYNLALMYLFGEGVDKNHDTAMSILKRAVSNGSSDACLVLGEAFEAGTLECDNDYVIAAKYYIAAIRLGSTKGIHCLGGLIEKGSINQKDLGDLMQNYRLDDF